jgi:Tfp pilus assembly protein FimV
MMRMGRQAAALLPATAAGLLLAFTHAAPALEIGDLVAGSQLGQPLSARVAVNLAAGESLDPGCVTVAGGGAGLPAVAGLGATVTPAVGPATASIRLDSPRPLSEPAYGLTVRVACPGMPASQREFVLIPDLPGTGAAPGSALPPPSSAPAVATMQGAADTAAAPERGDDGAPPLAAAPARALTPLAPGDSHVVQVGETLWSIAVRATVAGSSPRLKAAAIHAANAQAFLGGDPARLMAGATLVIPAETASLPVADRSALAAVDLPAPAAARGDAGDLPAASPVATAAPAGPMDLPVADTSDASASGDTSEPAVEAAGAGLATTAAALPAAAGAVAPAPAPRPRPARQPPAAAPARSPQQSGADPLVSALAGTAFGLLAGSPFWWRSRRRATAVAAEQPVAGQPEPVRVAIPVTPAVEPAIAVSFEPLPAGEAPVAGAYPQAATGAASGAWRQRSEETTRSQRLRPADDITSELEELFNTAPGEAAADTTVRRPWTPGNGMIDLPALAQGSDTDEHQAQGLRDALALLERDYEQEWTGSRPGPVATDPPPPDATPTAPIRRLG